jgi:hypothetical protein
MMNTDSTLKSTGIQVECTASHRAEAHIMKPVVSISISPDSFSSGVGEYGRAFTVPARGMGLVSLDLSGGIFEAAKSIVGSTFNGRSDYVMNHPRRRAPQHTNR